jgi:hypothetical protein
MIVGMQQPARQYLPLMVYGVRYQPKARQPPRPEHAAARPSRLKLRMIECNSTPISQIESTDTVMFYMYIPPSPMSPHRLVSDCFSNNVAPCQGAGARTPENSARHPCSCRIIVSDQIEEFISSETCGDDEMSFPRGNGICFEGKRRSIASI